MKGINFIALIAVCFVCAVVTDWKIDDFERYLEQKAKQSSISRPKATVSQASQIGYSDGIDVANSNLVDSKNETLAPPEAEQVFKPADKPRMVELAPYRIEKIHKVRIDGPGKYSIITEHETGILAHELFYIDAGGTRDTYLHHFIAENSQTDFTQSRRTINVRIINDAEKGKMWGEIKKFHPQHFHVELHVNMEQDPIE